ncbi:MAG: DnaD domain-containing protein [Chloroflexota bacterium]
MKTFNGFNSTETFTSMPDTLFRELLAEIEDADELKATLHALWRIEHQEGQLRFLRVEDFGGFASGVDKAVSRGSLLKVQTGDGTFILLNSPRGRMAAEAIQSGRINPSQIQHMPPVEHSNIFQLYEENIGVLTPLIADMLREAESEYPQPWFAEAFEIAVAKNARSWKYVEAVLRRWKEKGYDGKNRKDAVQDFKRYTEGEFADYFRDTDDAR